MSNNSHITARDVAIWMMSEVDRVTYLYQEQVVYDIQNRFGTAFVYENENGNLAISRDVLTQFRKLSDGDIVWERGEKMWRRRSKYDNLGRQQD